MVNSIRLPSSGCTPVAVLLLAALLSAPSARADTARGEAIFQKECANCHGADGWGGKAGEYPRLAGMPAGYLRLQLEGFRDGKRKNKPMLPIFKAGRLTRDDIAAVAELLASLPAPGPERVGVEAPGDYDREWGEELYVEGCLLCHGADGNGKPDTDNPPLIRQYPAYLIKQIRDFRSGKRWHEYAEALFQEAEPDELDVILDYVLELNQVPPAVASEDG